MSAQLYKAVICFAVLYSAVMGYDQEEITGWTNKQADIYFLLDSSASIWIVDFQKMLQFVVELVSYMDIGPSTTRVGVGVFSSRHYLHIPLNNNFTKQKLQEEIQAAPYLKGSTFISRALEGMLVQGLSPNITRPGVPLIAIMITDGMSRHKQLAADNATLAKQHGIFLFTVGIGNRVDRDELREIASDPKRKFNYHVDNFDNLIHIQELLSNRISEVEFLQNDEGMCGDASNVDTVFVFDEAALGEQDTHHVKGFIAALASHLSMNSGKFRLGLISTICRDGDRMLGQYVTQEDFIAGLQTRDDQDISDLLKRARLESFLVENGARFHAKHRIVLILHSGVRRRVEILRQVSKARHVGIEVFVIQLGTDYDKQYVHRLASHSDNTLFLNTASEMSLPDSKDLFIKSFCKDF